MLDQVKIFDCIHARDRKTIEKDINDWLKQKESNIIIIDLRMDEGSFYIWYRLQHYHTDDEV